MPRVGSKHCLPTALTRDLTLFPPHLAHQPQLNSFSYHNGTGENQYVNVVCALGKFLCAGQHIQESPGW